MSEQAKAAAKGAAQQSASHYITVDTYDASTSNQIGHRVVDMHHRGTADWLYGKHLYWATKNGHETVIQPASEAEVAEYMLEQQKLLAEKYAKVAA